MGHKGKIGWGLQGKTVHPEKRVTCEEGQALLLAFGFCYI